MGNALTDYRRTRSRMREVASYNGVGLGIKREAPADADEEGPDVESDVYELRFCENENCGDALPLDKPGHYIRRGRRKMLLCAACYDAHKRERE